MTSPQPTLSWPGPIPAHPRLLASSDDWVRLARQVETDRVSRLLFQTLKRRAERIVAEAPLERIMTGRMLLMVSRQALERISLLSLVACVGGDRRFADRATAEMRALAAFSDWNPSHFLDSAEMALALAIGYDWLYETLDIATREAVETALLHKAILPSLDEGAASNWWLRADENWVQVCHGGLAAAAIAVADKDPALSGTILQRAVDRLPLVAQRYAPDGAYPEGPMYWSYGTAYHVMLAAALERFTGSTHRIERYPGFFESSDYIAHVTAPSGDYFNYSDCAPRRRLQAQLFWMANQTGRLDWLSDDFESLERDLTEYESDPGVQYWYYDMVALALLWHRPIEEAKRVPRQRLWSGAGASPVALYRWGKDQFLGIKGGSVGVSHSHMDLGSFVYEAKGVRWAVDCGMQDYDSLESAGVDLWNETDQDSQRWDVFRIGPDSHNILRFDGKPQLLNRHAAVLASDEECVVDLTDVYEGVTAANRKFDIEEDGFAVLDEWTAAYAAAASSSWLTTSHVRIAKDRIYLRSGMEELELQVTASCDFTISIIDVSLPPRSFDAPNPNLKRIEIRCDAVENGQLRLKATALGLSHFARHAGNVESR